MSSAELVGLLNDVRALAHAGTLPARLSDAGGLVVYTQRHTLTLYPGHYGHGYRAGHAGRLTFRDHAQLLTGALLLQCPAVHAYDDLRNVPAIYSTQFALLEQAWRSVHEAGPPAAGSLPAAHSKYLDLLNDVVEATHDIEIDRLRGTRPIPYRDVTAAQEERHSARSIYTFHLVDPVALARRSAVFLTDAPDLRGQVTTTADRSVTIRFASPVDFGRIPQQGALQLEPSDSVYRAQLDAIKALRTGRTANTHLLTALVDHQLEAYQPDRSARPHEPLDEGQLAAFSSALTVPDQLLVLGPPGTGKTRTIAAIAAGCAARGQRVLVTAYTNAAVDNVLTTLPSRVRAVRVGNEHAMTNTARTFMVENQVDTLRQHILGATDGTASRLSTFDAAPSPADRWHTELLDRYTTATRADQEAAAAETALRVYIGQAHTALVFRLSTVGSAVKATRASASSYHKALEQADQCWRRADARTRRGIWAWLFRWLAERRRKRLERAHDAYAAATSELARAEHQLSAVQAEVDTVVAGDPGAAPFIAACTTTAAAQEVAFAALRDGAAAVRALLAGVAPVPTEDPTELSGWPACLEAIGRAVALGAARARLLTDWRMRLGDEVESLQRELVRYADVVAATCPGTATTPLLAELIFDIAIVDEAGQVSTPNLIVPLVRARRAVLVGDHMQLPPFLDDEVAEWAEQLRRRPGHEPARIDQIGSLLRRSAFENLYGLVDPSHKIMLTVQRRMPEPLARFVSDTFYSGQLTTVHAGGLTDPLFQSPLALVDTADRPAHERAERASGNTHASRGYANDYEARLIAHLVTVYRRWYPNWAVIVPYRAQVDRITGLLTDALGEAGTVMDSVNTVDSFQGGERDLILYGFTRSNARGSVGFLKELRRFNVAISRARRQLILVGDSYTLHRAQDTAFAAVFRSMTDHLAHSGDIQPSSAVREQLMRLNGKAR